MSVIISPCINKYLEPPHTRIFSNLEPAKQKQSKKSPQENKWVLLNENNPEREWWKLDCASENDPRHELAKGDEKVQPSDRDPGKTFN